MYSLVTTVFRNTNLNRVRYTDYSKEDLGFIPASMVNDTARGIVEYLQRVYKYCNKYNNNTSIFVELSDSDLFYLRKIIIVHSFSSRRVNVELDVVNTCIYKLFKRKLDSGYVGGDLSSMLKESIKGILVSIAYELYMDEGMVSETLVKGLEGESI